MLGLLLYATTFLAGLLFLGPESGRIGKLMEEGSPEVGPRMLRLIMLARLDLVLLFGIIFVHGREARVRRLGAARGAARRRCLPAGSSTGGTGSRSRSRRPGPGPEPVGDVPAEPS